MMFVESQNDIKTYFLMTYSLWSMFVDDKLNNY